MRVNCQHGYILLHGYISLICHPVCFVHCRRFTLALTRLMEPGSVHKDLIFSHNALLTVTKAVKRTLRELTLNAPITTKVVCFSGLLKCLRNLYGKQCDSVLGPCCLLLYLILQ